MNRAIAIAAGLVVLALAAPTAAQVLMRRPYSGTYRLNYARDNDGGRAGCDDYTCASACYDGHSGSDFGLPFGSEVRAGAAGRVVSSHDGCADYGFLGSTCGGRCGNHIELQHSDGSRSIYCHMRRGTIRFDTGDTVACGALLGSSASSGNSTGAHLHFGWRRSSSVSYTDPFRGTCGSSVSRWVDQRGYREAPGTACDCTPSAETCNGRDDDCDGVIDDGVTRACSSACGSGSERCSAGTWGACSARTPVAEVCNAIDDDCDGATNEDEVCEVTLLIEQPAAYAAPRSTDIDGDGLMDVCARGGSGVRCWPSLGTGWDASLPPVPWSNASGWDDADNFATIRMGDVDGDGMSDLCARANSGVVCARSSGSAFEAPALWLADLSDEAGFDVPSHFTTLRMADVDGDGRDDLCARGSAGLDCWRSTGASFADVIPGPRWSDAAGFALASRYGTIRTGDVDGDGRADVCARTGEGIECWTSSLSMRVEGPRWSDAGGWAAMEHWSTIRLLDYDGDGRDDVCGRDAESLSCARSLGTSFAAPVVVAPLSDASGWADVTNYASVGTGDVDGDGRSDLCARANAGMRCWAFDGVAFRTIVGPAWSDEGGWAYPEHYETIRLADFDGDGLDDLCARANAGWRCHPSLGDSFGAAVVLDELRDDGSWDELAYYSTILSAGHACRAGAEVCNGRDDDCDRVVDEDVCVLDAGAPDAGSRPSAAPDAGLGGDGSVAPRDRPAAAPGCACTLASAATQPGAPVWLVVASLLLVVATRTRSRPRLLRDVSRGPAPVLRRASSADASSRLCRAGADRRSPPRVPTRRRRQRCCSPW